MIVSSARVFLDTVPFGGYLIVMRRLPFGDRRMFDLELTFFTRQQCLRERGEFR